MGKRKNPILVEKVRGDIQRKRRDTEREPIEPLEKGTGQICGGEKDQATPAHGEKKEAKGRGKVGGRCERTSIYRWGVGSAKPSWEARGGKKRIDVTRSKGTGKSAG